MYSLDEEENDEEKEEKLPNDYSSPFSPPEGQQDRIPQDHQSLDALNSDQEWYDEGREGEAETHDPGDQGIKGYHPKDETPPKNGPVESHEQEEAG